MLIKLSEALDHIRMPADYPPSQVMPYLLAAEASVQAFCQRRFYVDAASLKSDRDTFPGKVKEARQAYEDAVEAANTLEDINEKEAALKLACQLVDEAMQSCDEILVGMVLPDDVRAAILLQLDHLFENRSENVTGTIVSELKTGVQSLLWPYRVRIGV